MQMTRRKTQSEFGMGRKQPPKKKVCRFCIDRITKIDYKDIGTLRRYLTDRAKILPRRVTGNCALHQHLLTKAIKLARRIALLPYTGLIISD